MLSNHWETKQITQSKKWAKDNHLTREEIQMATKLTRATLPLHADRSSGSVPPLITTRQRQWESRQSRASEDDCLLTPCWWQCKLSPPPLRAVSTKADQMCTLSRSTSKRNVYISAPKNKQIKRAKIFRASSAETRNKPDSANSRENKLRYMHSRAGS